MAQTEGTSILEFEGTTDDVVVLTGATGALATVNYSVDSSTATVVEFDNTAANRSWHSAKAKFSGTYASTPTAGATIDIYIYEDVDGTYEEPPTSTAVVQGKYRGGLKVEAATAQVSSTEISLFGVKKCKFAIYNGGDQNISTGWTLTIEGIGFNTEAA